jgi:hypothetical protein
MEGLMMRSLLLAAMFVSPALPDSTPPTAQLLFHGDLMSSVTLIFQNNPNAGKSGYCPLTNSGTNNVGLDLGSASATTPDNLACVQYTSFFGYYLVSSAFDVLVGITNSSSPNYQLAAQISTAPPAGVSWLINGTTMSTSLTTIETANGYAQPVTQTLRVLVNNTAVAQTLAESINFLATAN